MTATFSLNGKQTRLTGPTTIADAVRSAGADPSGRGLAVAVNGEVVPRSEWQARSVEMNDKVEVLTARGGG